jgi:spore maturation protein CgeB
MRLLIVGSDNEYAIENFYVKYLREAGVEVFHFPAQTIFHKYYQQGLVNKVLFRAGLSTILKKINGEFKVVVHDFSPDIIWIFKGMEIFPDSLKWARARGIKLANYNGDSPFIFSGRGSGNKNVTASIGLYDLFLTYSSVDRNTMESKFKVQSEILPFGFDVSDNVYNISIEAEEIKKVCFVGNPDSMRANFIKELANKGVASDVYGSSWNNFINHPKVSIFEPVKHNEFWKTLRKYRIQLNLMRPHNPTTHNMRTFECGGIGAIQLAPNTWDHRRCFKNEEEIFLFENIEECMERIEYLINMGKEESAQVRENVRRRSVQDGYSYQCRSMQALSHLNKLL